MTQHQRLIDPSWVVIVAGICAALHVGKLPPALPVLQMQMGITLLQAGFLLSLVQMSGMALGLVVGLSADSFGLKKTMMLGLSLLVSASFVGAGMVDVTSLLVLRAIEGFGFLCVVMSGPALIRATVEPQHLAARMSWWGTYMPLGSALALLAGPFVIGAMGWPLWWCLLALITWFALVLVWWCVPSDSAQLKPTVQSRWQQRLSLTLHTPGVWYVSWCFAVYSSQWMAVVGFLPMMYSQTGMHPALNGVLTAIVALVNASGNIASGQLLQRGWHPRQLIAIGFTCMALGAMMAFVVIDGVGLPFALRFVGLVMFSSVGGLIPGTLFSTAVKLAPSDQTVSTTVGWMQQWSAMGQFVGPPLVVWVAASIGGWQWTWCVTVGFSCIGAIMAFKISQELAHKNLTHA
ncbi:MAG: MFS transporter [Limnohabitans sp.]|nr:MFS transporter [Limnohabitans sp.]